MTAKFSNMSAAKLVFLDSDVSGDTCFLKVTGEPSLVGYIHTCLLILQPNWLACGARYTLRI